MIQCPVAVPSWTRRAPLVAAAAVATALLAACASAGAGATPSPPATNAANASHTVDVTLSEFKVQLSTTSLPAGKVTFQVKNAGTVQHEFVIMRTSLNQTALPLSSDKTDVDENSSWLERMGEADHIDPGKTKSFTVSLPAGAYVGLCNLPGHYGAGMRVAITAK
jgi:uncharacterized cupredoxin-like copper-binding protein